MELIDLIVSFPIWMKIILFLLALEWLTTHIRLNMCLISINRIETLLAQLLSETKENKNEHVNEQRLLNLLIGSTAKKRWKKDGE